MLRAFHATACKYVINKLRWEQTHNGYIPNADAWNNHTTMIHKLEDELKTIECAQAGLDKFPNCHYPIAENIKHGPVTLDVVVAKEIKDATRDKMIDKELERVYPFFRQLHHGPRTRMQDKAHAELREILMSGGYYPDDLEELLPTENLRRYNAGEPFDIKPSPKPVAKAPSPAPAPKKRLTYDEARCEKENVKIVAQLKEKGLEAPALKTEERKKEGPITQEEYLASLPKYGPKTKGEVMLPIQREQRALILAWLRQPWGEYDEEAAGLIHKMGNMAFAKLEEKGKKERAAKEGVKEVKKDEVEAKAERVEQVEKETNSPAKEEKADEKVKSDKGKEKVNSDEGKAEKENSEATVKAAKKDDAPKAETNAQKEERKTTVVEITVQAEEIVEGAEYQDKGKTEVVVTQKGEDGDGETTVVGVVEVVM